MYFTYKQRCSVPELPMLAIYENHNVNYIANQVPIKRDKTRNTNNVACLSNKWILL